MTGLARPTTRVVLAAGLTLCLASTAAAQGQVRGLVRDRAGTGIAGAEVTADSLVSQASQTAASDDSGRFAFIGLNRGEWLFVIRADGYEPVQGFVGVRASGPATRVQFTMDRDVFDPPAPSSGVLAGLKSSALVALLNEADQHFAEGDYDAAIESYESLLARAPSLTSLHLSIGHALAAKNERSDALAAYRRALEADPTSVAAQAAIAALAPGAR